MFDESVSHPNKARVESVLSRDGRKDDPGRKRKTGEEDGAEPKRELKLKSAFFDLDGTSSLRVDRKQIGRFMTKL